MGLSGIPGVTVYLFTSDGVLLQSRLTGTDGTYEFNNIPPGDYYDPGENDPSWDAGAFIGVGGEAQMPSSIGSRVWDDEDRNGIQDQGEGGVPGVTVRLYTSDGTLVASTTTDPTGGYLFANITAGDYYLEFDKPRSFSFSPEAVGGNDATDSNVNPTTGRTEIITLEPGEVDLQFDAGIFQTPGNLDSPTGEPIEMYMFLPLVTQ